MGLGVLRDLLAALLGLLGGRLVRNDCISAACKFRVPMFIIEVFRIPCAWSGPWPKRE